MRLKTGLILLLGMAIGTGGCIKVIEAQALARGATAHQVSSFAKADRTDVR